MGDGEGNGGGLWCAQGFPCVNPKHSQPALGRAGGDWFQKEIGHWAAGPVGHKKRAGWSPESEHCVLTFLSLHSSIGGGRSGGKKVSKGWPVEMYKPLTGYWCYFFLSFLSPEQATK